MIGLLAQAGSGHGITAALAQEEIANHRATRPSNRA
jgi:hypothetical protein